jgi:hypothetical protein
MKTRYTMLTLALGLSVAAFAQESDDMYFNSKDRAVVVKANEVVLAKKYRQDDIDAVRSNPVNPSDSYSGRGVNPEYNAQAKNGTSIVNNDPDYFVSGFQPKNVNSNLYNNSSAYSSTNYNNSAYGYGGFGSPYSAMYSPYAFGYSPYSMMYSPYSMMYSPYSMYSPYGGMYGMGMGSGFYSGFGMGYSMMYGSPYSMIGFGYGMGSMYSPYGYGYGGYPSTVVVTDQRNTAYGRHPSRSSGLNNYVSTNTRNDATIVGSNGRVREGGRSRTDSQPNYYNSGWRNSSDYSNTRSGYSGGNSGWSGGNTGNSWGNGGNTRSSFDNFGGSRSSFGGGHSGGFSGGGFSGGGGGGGGHSRGRN